MSLKVFSSQSGLLIIRNKTEDKKNSTIFIVTFLSLFIFNVFDSAKNYKQIPNFSKEVNKAHNQRTLIIILDEMSGLNSISSDTNEFVIHIFSTSLQASSHGSHFYKIVHTR